MLRSLLCAVFLAVLFTGTARADGAPAQLVTSWTELTWAFPSRKEARAFEASGTARRAPLANLKVGRDGEIYVTVPRWMDKNVPATLNKVVNVGGRSVLEPFPSWASNRL